MRHDTLLKVIIAVFGIILIVLATFVYGNVQRSKQKAQNNQPNNTTQTQEVSQTPTKNDNQANTNQAPAAQSAKTPVAPTKPASTSIPNTGASGLAAIPMTIIAVLGYVLRGQHSITRSKSQLH